MRFRRRSTGSGWAWGLAFVECRTLGRSVLRRRAGPAPIDTTREDCSGPLGASFEVTLEQDQPVVAPKELAIDHEGGDAENAGLARRPHVLVELLLGERVFELGLECRPREAGGLGAPDAFVHVDQGGRAV